MITQTQHILIFIASVTGHTVLSQQCWHESPFHTVTLQTSLSGSQERVLSFVQKEKDRTPWTHRPMCTDVLESIGESLCIYTSTTFASGRGISIFTTPSLAEKFASLSAFTHPAGLGTEGVNEPTGTYRTQEIAGKGIGVLASRDLDFGDRITAHTPSFIAYLESELSTLNREKWWRTAIDQLPASLREMFLALSIVYGDERVRVQDIVKANTFQLEIGGVKHLAIWPETSRLNHDCAPKYVLPLLSYHPLANNPPAPNTSSTRKH
jgi:hypothetical protein